MMIDFFRLEPAMINQTRLEPRLNGVTIPD